MTNQDDELIKKICALYQRARLGQLTEEDIVAPEAVAQHNHADYVETVYYDKARFNDALGAFGATYEIFKVFNHDHVVLDVGAHWGYSVVAMRHQGCGAHIHSIEAMPLNAPALNRLKRIENGLYNFDNVAASDVKATIRFYVPVMNGVPNTGLATTGGTLDDYYAPILAKMANTHGPAQGGINRVGLLVLDIPAEPIDLIVERNVGTDRPIAAIKMDVEGHEGAAIKGARQVLAQFTPLVMIEGANRNRDVVAEMTRHGYSHYERNDGMLSPRQDLSLHLDGFWVHAQKVESYRELGLMAPGVR